MPHAPSTPFRLRDIALTAYGPTVVSSTGHGAVMPILALRARDLGADVSTAAAVVALLGIGMLLASLPAGADVGLFKRQNGMDVQVGTATTSHALFPGQTEELAVSVDPMMANNKDQFIAKTLIDPQNPKFHECREDNNESDLANAHCVQ